MNDFEKMYTEEEMIDEVCDTIAAMGGVVDIIDKTNHIFKITIDPYLETDAASVVENIISRYIYKREEAFRNNPFLRALSIREEIYGKEEV
jgi:hypothetical protein